MEFILFSWFTLHFPWIWQDTVWGKYSSECWITTSLCWLEREAKGCSIFSLITIHSIYSIPKGIKVYPHLLNKECEKNFDAFQNHHRGKVFQEQWLRMMKSIMTQGMKFYLHLHVSLYLTVMISYDISCD